MRVLLADDHRLLVEGLTNLLNAHGIEVLGAAGDGFEACAMARDLRPDLILMDLRMPNCDGLTATRLIKDRMPEIKIVMLTTSAEDQDLFEAVKGGACGYLLKSVGGDEFIEILRGLEDGFPPFSPGLADKILAEFSRQSTPLAGVSGADEDPSPLTVRQREVLSLVAQGYSYKEAGNSLGLSARTIKYHMREIVETLHLENRTQALAYAARIGLARGS
ncbi:MAG: response regulator transcription factor [Chloroflexi bacterium]|nr:response regulator transcription factor [Chloroflexota bacterium]